jgi:hypothetical protein
MANHLTPEEICREFGMKRDDVIRICVQEGVPIYHGKIDKTLFGIVRGDQSRDLAVAVS